MAKNEKGGGAQSKPPKQQQQADDSQAVPRETSSELIRRIELLDGSQTSIGGGVKAVGETAQGPVRSSALGTYNRVVMLAIDASPAAMYAFQWYLKHIWRREDLLVLAHIPETPTLANVSFKKGLSLPTDEWVKAMQSLNEKTRLLQEEFEAECVKYKIKYKLVGESAKSPGEALCRTAHDEKADMIVIGSRGLSSVKRAMLGSVSEYVVRNSYLPVVVVHKKQIINPFTGGGTNTLIG